jgi:hypothetical protein
VPSFSVKTSSTQVFLTGTGEALFTDDWYSAKFTIPPTAPNSTVENQWSITWTSGTVQKVVYFDVEDKDISEDEIYLKELHKFALEAVDYDFKIVIPVVPEECEAFFYNSSRLLASALDCEIVDHRLGAQITGTIDGEFLTAGEFTLVYKTDIGNYMQTILVLPIKYFPVMTGVRFLIDRILKDVTEPQAILESDLAASVFGGIEVINITAPVTEWNITNLPSTVVSFLKPAACIYMLNSQYMLESDLAFAYSGNTVSLDYDHTGAIESALGRFQEQLQENLGRAKNSILNANPGVVGLTTSPNGPNFMRIRNNIQFVRKW